MASVEKISQNGLDITMLVTFETGDAVVSDDGTGTTFDSVTVDLRPSLDKFFPGWRSHDLAFMIALMPGDALAVPDGVQVTANIPYAALGDDAGNNPKTLSSAIDSRAGLASIDAILCLSLGDQAASALAATEAHRAIVVGMPRTHPALGATRVTSLPETFTVDTDA